MLDEVFLEELTRQLAPENIAAIVPLQIGAAVADATAKYLIRTQDRNLVLIISNQVSPYLVQRAVERQTEARSRLNAHAAEAIELPVYAGFIDGKSCALWPHRRPLSTSQIRGRIQKFLIAPKVFNWLREVCSQTARPGSLSDFICNVQRLQEIPGAPVALKGAAEKALKLFQSGEIPPIHVAQHGDLHRGNVLRSPSENGFIVIDWAGARMDGVPFFDLIAFSVSIGAPKFMLRRELRWHSKVLGCEPGHAMAYLLSGLGALHAELEHFPEESFLRLCERKLSWLQLMAEHPEAN